MNGYISGDTGLAQGQADARYVKIDGVSTAALLCEYLFQDTGAVAQDNSGNGNNGAYVAAPAMVPGGGFTATSTQYVTGVAAAWASMQTVNIVCDVPTPNTSIYPAIIGNSLGSEMTLIANGAQGSLNQAYLFGAGNTLSADTMPPGPVLITLLIDATNTSNDRIFFNGIEVQQYFVTGKSGSSRGGVPWLGHDEHGWYLQGQNIYYFSTYSAYQSPQQILANAAAIRGYLTGRGTALPASLNQTTGASVSFHFGDSLTYGLDSSNPYTSQLSLIDAPSVYNRGQTAMTAAQLAYALPGVAAQLYSPTGARNTAVIWVGTNDVYNSEIPFTAYLSTRRCCLAARKLGYQVVVCTMIDRGAAGTVGQAAFNSLIRNNWRQFADEIADLGSEPLLGAFNSAAQNGTYFFTDFTHLLAAGDAIVAAYVSAASNRLANSRNLSVPGPIFTQNAATAPQIANTATETSVIGAGYSDQVMLGTTNSTTSVTGLNETGTLVVGQPVSGSGIPVGATIAAIPSAGAITLSAAAATSVTNVSLTFGGIPFKGYFWYPGKALRIEQRGLLSAAASQTLNRKLYWGATVLGATGAITPPAVSQLPYVMDGVLTCIGIGAAGTFWFHGELRIQSAANGAYNVFPMTNAAPITLNTNGDSLLKITDTWGAANAGDIDNAQTLLVELLP